MRVRGMRVGLAVWCVASIVERGGEEGCELILEVKVVAAGEVVQEAWRWVRRWDAAVVSVEKSVFTRSMTNSAGLVYRGIW